MRKSVNMCQDANFRAKCPHIGQHLLIWHQMCDALNPDLGGTTLIF